MTFYTAVVDESVEMLCDMTSTVADDQVQLVLWYREE